MTATADVLVVGAGVIGLGIAWRCRQRGLTVTVLDPAPGSGASRTAAGMLAPITELHYGERALLELNLESARRYPDFVAELSSFTGVDVGYRRCGTIAVAWDGADLAALAELRTFATSLGQHADLLTGRELRALEPALASGLPGGMLAANDHQVDNRLLHQALLVAARQSGADIEAGQVSDVLTAAGRVHGVRLATGEDRAAGVTVLAAGAWTGRLGALPVRPVKGQTLRLRLPGAPIASHTIRGSVKGNPVYIVARADGRLVVGASSEEAGFDVRPRAGAVYELLRDAQSLLPLLGEAELEEVSTGLRPGSPDNAPLLGACSTEGLIAASGHYRNGILLTPVTADSIAQLIADGTVDASIAPFAADRFERALTAVPQ